MRLEDAYALCRRVAHRSGPNFSVGFRFLPRAKRQAVYATYAFCRFVDDVVDEDPGHDDVDVRKRVDRWEQELERCYRGSPAHPTTVALADAASRYPIPKESFAGLIEGCRMDLVKTRYETYQELLVYSDLVATTISTMSLAIFGYGDRAAIERGRDLATAFQLTNILRDVGEDAAEKDRIYLPREELRQFGVSEDELRSRRATPAFEELMRFQVERVRGFYRRAEPLLDFIEPDCRRCTSLMGAVYCRILEKIEEEGYPVLERRVTLSLANKLGLVTGAMVSSRPSWIEELSLSRG
ncbi:MAG TPA: presqualene diphosphate synthase HpnD [Vicinamibacteria bacterium]